MNHEMRTPMHAVIALSSLLNETELSEEQRSMVDTVVKSGTVLSTLINDVLDFSRLEDGRCARAFCRFSAGLFISPTSV